MTLAAPFLYLFLLGTGFCLYSIFLTPLVRKFAISVGCVARPSNDRWGRRVVARLGGFSIALGFLGAVGWTTQQEPRMVGLLFGGLLMLLTGLIDDFRGIHPYSKLIAQIIAGCLVVIFGIQIDVTIPWLALPLTIGWLVLVMNAFNLMDNMDGLAAGIGVIATGFCIWQTIQKGEWLIAIVATSLAGSTLGFLRYNFPPAKIFMGDTGSQVLGLGLGSVAVMGTWHQSTRLLSIVALPTLLLAVPIFDTFFVTIQRILHGRHPFQGGRDHLSHRLGILGLTTRQVVLTLYGMSAVCGALGVVLTTQSSSVVIGIGLLVVGLFLIVGSYLGKIRVYVGSSAPRMEPRVTLIETMLLHKRRITEVLVDFILICASYVMAHALRFEANITPDVEALILKSLPWVVAIKLLCFFSCGLYRGVWRYISLPDLVNIFRAVTIGSVLSALVLLYLWRFEGYSRAAFIIDGLLLFVVISGARLAEPLLNEWVSACVRGATPVLIIGAGDTGELLLQQLKLSPQRKRRVIGFLDDDVTKQGDCIHGVQIIGSRQELGRVVHAFGVREVLIAMQQPPTDLVQQIKGYCEENGLEWRVVQTMAPIDR